jgi:hypothetical protein
MAAGGIASAEEDRDVFLMQNIKPILSHNSASTGCVSTHQNAQSLPRDKDSPTGAVPGLPLCSRVAAMP